MRIRTILTTAAVSAALVAGGVAGPASAAVAPVTVQPVITVPTVAVTVPAFTASLPITVNASTPANTRVSYWLVTNGVPASQLSLGYTDAAGNVTGDLNALRLSSTPLPAGTYQIYFTTDATTAYFSDPTPDVNYLAAQSATISLTVTKIQTSITGWKTKSKSARYGKLIRTSSPTMHNLDAGATIVFQYKKKGGKWKTSEVSRGYSNALVASFKLKTKPFNSVKNQSKPVKRGTYYFRVLVKDTPYAVGAATKQIKLTWK